MKIVTVLSLSVAWSKQTINLLLQEIDRTIAQRFVPARPSISFASSLFAGSCMCVVSERCLANRAGVQQPVFTDIEELADYSERIVSFFGLVR